jgi:hypothetical protein
MAVDPRRAHWWWREEPCAPSRAVIVDIDGVLADAQGRQHLLRGELHDWNAFFDASGSDPVFQEVHTLLTLLDPSLLVLLVTARPVRVRSVTLEWLGRHELRYDLLAMRPAGEFAPAADVKRDVLGELREDSFSLELAIEDDPSIKDMYDDEGVPCLYLHSGYYD